MRQCSTHNAHVSFSGCKWREMKKPSAQAPGYHMLCRGICIFIKWQCLKITTAGFIFRSDASCCFCGGKKLKMPTSKFLQPELYIIAILLILQLKKMPCIINSVFTSLLYELRKKQNISHVTTTTMTTTNNNSNDWPLNTVKVKMTNEWML